MQATVFAGLAAGVFLLTGGAVRMSAQAPKDAPKSAMKDSPTADATRTILLKTKVTVGVTDQQLGEILKEFAHLVNEKSDDPLLWAYGPKFPFEQKVTFAVKDQPLDAALDQLFAKAGGGLGYVVVSKEGDKYDGWVRLTTTGERGYEPPPASAEDEATAADRLALAKRLIDGGKPSSAKPVLDIIVRKYPTTKAAAEAKELISKIEKDK